MCRLGTEVALLSHFGSELLDDDPEELHGSLPSTKSIAVPAPRPTSCVRHDGVPAANSTNPLSGLPRGPPERG
ncbi:MAG: hypothetical protein DHS20C15_03270 [Planctomycetota bacterium]|nr:MAG: hypothetical protein DHS20C15_03270 [Planctomycetota bacterium]